MDPSFSTKKRHRPGCEVTHCYMIGICRNRKHCKRRSEKTSGLGSNAFITFVCFPANRVIDQFDYLIEAWLYIYFSSRMSAEKATILDRIKRNNNLLPPPKQWWRQEGAKTRHFGIIEMERRGGPDGPFIVSKIVVLRYPFTNSLGWKQPCQTNLVNGNGILYNQGKKHRCDQMPGSQTISPNFH